MHLVTTVKMISHQIVPPRKRLLELRQHDNDVSRRVIDQRICTLALPVSQVSSLMFVLQSVEFQADFCISPISTLAAIHLHIQCREHVRCIVKHRCIHFQYYGSGTRHLACLMRCQRETSSFNISMAFKNDPMLHRFP